VFLPNEKLGFFQYRNLTFNTYIEAYKITRDKKKYTEIDLNNQTALQVLEEFNKLEFSEFYSRISRSIAPEIFGMEDVKKALLLMMITGVTKEMHDGMRIRGDINVALIGDPGVAKSQLLKFICSASPRAIYTTGKGSSSVGLTAAVIRDEITSNAYS
jgi:DNA replication licensing factor MCM7